MALGLGRGRASRKQTERQVRFPRRFRYSDVLEDLITVGVEAGDDAVVRSERGRRGLTERARDADHDLGEFRAVAAQQVKDETGPTEVLGSPGIRKLEISRDTARRIAEFRRMPGRGRRPTARRLDAADGPVSQLASTAGRCPRQASGSAQGARWSPRSLRDRNRGVQRRSGL